MLRACHAVFLRIPARNGVDGAEDLVGSKGLSTVILVGFTCHTIQNHALVERREGAISGRACQLFTFSPVLKFTCEI